MGVVPFSIWILPSHPPRETTPLPRTDARAAPSQRAQNACVRTTRQPRVVRLLRAVAIATSLLACPWTIPGAEAARGTNTRAGDDHHRRAAVVAQPRRAKASAPVMRGARRAVPTRAAAIQPPVAAVSPISAPADSSARIDPVVVLALDGAARAVGTDPALLLAMAWKESRFDPTARNPQSSARGLMQFTRVTWLEVVRDFGHRHGLAHHAALLTTDHRDGTISARHLQQLTQIMQLRDDPRLSAIMAAERISRERIGLEQVLGRATAPADLYIVHLLGPMGARRFLTELRRAPSRLAAEAVGQDSVGVNQGVFVARGSGRPLSLAEVYAAIGRLVEEQRTARAGPLADIAVASTTDTSRRGASYVEMAEAR